MLCALYYIITLVKINMWKSNNMVVILIFMLTLTYMFPTKMKKYYNWKQPLGQ